MKSVFLIATIAALAPAAALAHGGHGGEAGHAHAIGSLEVLALMLAVGAGALGLRHLVRSRQKNK